MAAPAIESPIVDAPTAAITSVAGTTERFGVRVSTAQGERVETFCKSYIALDYAAMLQRQGIHAETTGPVAGQEGASQ